MNVFTFEVALWIQLFAAGLGGLHGALFAAGASLRHIDILGVLVIGLTVALGGSLLRDVVLNQPPAVIWENGYLLVAAAGAIVGLLLQGLLARAEWAFTVFDAIVMGLFGAIGASKALSLDVGEVGAVVVGVVGAIGGGTLRDIMLNRPISILHVGTLYAVAAGAGAGSLVLVHAFGAPIAIAGLVCVAVTTAMRLVALLFGWTLPEPQVARLRRRRAPEPLRSPLPGTEEEQP